LTVSFFPYFIPETISFCAPSFCSFRHRQSVAAMSGGSHANKNERRQIKYEHPKKSVLIESGFGVGTKGRE